MRSKPTMDGSLLRLDMRLLRQSSLELDVGSNDILFKQRLNCDLLMMLLVRGYQAESDIEIWQPVPSLVMILLHLRIANIIPFPNHD